MSVMELHPVVIKIGGALFDDSDRLAAFWPALTKLADRGPVVIVHGGGPQATAMARRLGHEPTIIDGRRVTSALDLSIVHWTLCGEINTQLTAVALSHRIKAVGLTGIAGGTLQVCRRPPWTINGASVDFGFVGDVTNVNPSLLETLLAANYVPFIAPLGIDDRGQTYNVNADTVAHAIARALRAQSLLLVTESGGVRREASNANSLMAELDETRYSTGIEEGWITDGMLVKLKMAFEAKHGGIADVYILPPSDIFTRSHGTKIV